MRSERSHIAQRAANGLVVDLYRDPHDPGRKFRVEVVDRVSGERFVLFPSSGGAAIHTLHDPFAVEPREAPAARLTSKEEYR